MIKIICGPQPNEQKKRKSTNVGPINVKLQNRIISGSEIYTCPGDFSRDTVNPIIYSQVLISNVHNCSHQYLRDLLNLH